MFRIFKNRGSTADATLIVHSYSLSGDDYIVVCPHCHRPTNLFDGNIFGRKFQHAAPGYSGIGCHGIFKVSRDAAYSPI